MDTVMYGMGVTQLRRQPPERFLVDGIPYVLRKNAEDGTVLFNNSAVVPTAKSKAQIAKDLWAYYVTGVMSPQPGTLEKPVDVVYIGFHNIDFDPMMLGPKDILCMHVYAREGGHFGDSFVRGYLGVGQPEASSASVEQRAPVRPWPVETPAIVTAEGEIDGVSDGSGDGGADGKRNSRNARIEVPAE